MFPPVIAVLDLDPEFLRFMNAFLTDEGYAVSLSCDRDSFVAMVQRTFPDLVILDVWLDVPESGWAVLEALWTNPTTGTIPIIVCLSGKRPSATQTRLLWERHCAVVQKRFDLSEMLTLIETVLANATRFLPRTPGGRFASPLTLDG